MTSIDTLTFYQGQQTTSRRVAPVPQLQCVGGDGRNEAHHSVNVIQCRKVGSSYGNNIQWKCEAELPHSLRLGETTVSCEGFEHSDDPFVLDGSCGLEYTLHKTGASPYDGEGSHGGSSHHSYYGSSSGGSGYGYGGRSSSIVSWIWSAWSSWWSFWSYAALITLGWLFCGSSAVVWGIAAWFASSLFGISFSSMFFIGVLLWLLVPSRRGSSHYNSHYNSHHNTRRDFSEADPYRSPYSFAPTWGSSWGGGWGGRPSYGHGYGGSSSWPNFFTGMAAGGLASSMFGDHSRRTTTSSSYGRNRASFSSSGTSDRRPTHTSSGFGGTRNR
jgi:cbb3-type cytochrome oxidase subunit 3